MGGNLRGAMIAVVLAGWTGGAGAAAAEPDAARGAELYQLCAQCHGPAGEGQTDLLDKLGPEASAPAIAGLPEWYVAAQLQLFRSGARGIHPDDSGGLRMHPMALSLGDDADLEAVAAHAASLPPARPAPRVEGGDPQQGAARYALCAACHGPDGAGNEQMKAPPLAGASDWYLLSSLQKYRAGIRGSNPANPNGSVMRSFSAQLDDQAMLDLIAFINTLGAR